MAIRRSRTGSVKEFKFEAIHDALLSLDRERQKCETSTSTPTPEDYKQISGSLKKLLDKGDIFIASSDQLMLSALIVLQRLEAEQCTSESLARQLSDLQLSVIYELSEIKLALASKEMARYFNKEALFGEAVKAAFPSASDDIEAAGNCLALGMYTASVFHLMCVLEVGLDSLAHALHLPFKQESWGYILTGIKREVTEINEDSHGENWKQDKAYFSEAVLEFGFFKDAWRNRVAHARGKYSKESASKIMDHVKSFMIHLSARLKARPTSYIAPDPLPRYNKSHITSL